MEAPAKVHRQRHHRRSESRHSRHQQAPPTRPMITTTQTSATHILNGTAERLAHLAGLDTDTVGDDATRTAAIDAIVAIEEGCAAAEAFCGGDGDGGSGALATRLSLEHERQSGSLDGSGEALTYSTGGSHSSSQQTVVLVNGHAPPPESEEQRSNDNEDIDDLDAGADVAANVAGDVKATAKMALLETTRVSDKHHGVDDDDDIGEATSLPPAAAQPESSITHAQQKASNRNVAVPEVVVGGTVISGGGGGGGGVGGGGGSSRNSSGDAMSLRETLQQLPATLTSGHRHSRRNHSPLSPSRRGTAESTTTVDSSFHRGILGFMDRELKQSSPTPSALSVGGGSTGGGASRKLQSLSDPTASPAQRSVRSRSSIEKSPRRKRSKSESRRRRERKLIAAGEMEVRQANETLMRYLKQCSEMNDASLSGELEIDQTFDERRVHRKTKSQRDKRGQLISKLYSAGGLSSILKELSDDIVPAEGEEIYNPFTPVVSPTEDTPAHIDKMFLQTSSGYRPVEHCYYKHSFVGAGSYGGVGSGGGGTGRLGAQASAAGGGGGGNGCGGMQRFSAGTGMRASGSYGDTRYLLDADCGRNEINSNIELACVIQRIWLLISNICHGLLAGLALAHLLFVLSCHPIDWSVFLSLAGETNNEKTSTANAPSPASIEAADIDVDGSSASRTASMSATVSQVAGQQTIALLSDYAALAQLYLNTFYCLAIICLVSVFDRMDISRWDLSNATELISFRWLIIAMIYIATIILTICSDSIDEKLYYNNNANVTLTQGEINTNSIMNVWSSLSVTRSIGAICGWIMIGLTPHEDLLYEHLVDLTKYQLTNN